MAKNGVWEGPCGATGARPPTVVACVIFSTVSVHPAQRSEQGSGHSHHHSSERPKSIAKSTNEIKKTVLTGAPVEAPTAIATAVGLAMSLHPVEMTMALKKTGVVRPVNRGPHRRQTTHPHPHPHSHPNPQRRTVCLKTSFLGCSNLCRNGLLYLHYLLCVFVHLLSRRRRFRVLGGRLFHLRIALHHPNALHVQQLPSFLMLLLLLLSLYRILVCLRLLCIR